jgi:hypothetical protein
MLAWTGLGEFSFCCEILRNKPSVQFSDSADISSLGGCFDQLISKSANGSKQ